MTTILKEVTQVPTPCHHRIHALMGSAVWLPWGVQRSSGSIILSAFEPRRGRAEEEVEIDAGFVALSITAAAARAGIDVEIFDEFDDETARETVKTYHSMEFRVHLVVAFGKAMQWRFWGVHMLLEWMSYDAWRMTEDDVVSFPATMSESPLVRVAEHATAIHSLDAAQAWLVVGEASPARAHFYTTASGLVTRWYSMGFLLAAFENIAASMRVAGQWEVVPSAPKRGSGFDYAISWMPPRREAPRR